MFFKNSERVCSGQKFSAGRKTRLSEILKCYYSHTRTGYKILDFFTGTCHFKITVNTKIKPVISLLFSSE